MREIRSLNITPWKFFFELKIQIFVARNDYVTNT